MMNNVRLPAQSIFPMASLNRLNCDILSSGGSRQTICEKMPCSNLKLKEWPANSVRPCHNCHLRFDCRPWFIFENEIEDGTFVISGNFCSPGCSKAKILRERIPRITGTRLALLKKVFVRMCKRVALYMAEGEDDRELNKNVEWTQEAISFLLQTHGQTWYTREEATLLDGTKIRLELLSVDPTTPVPKAPDTEPLLEGVISKEYFRYIAGYNCVTPVFDVTATRAVAPFRYVRENVILEETTGDNDAEDTQSLINWIAKVKADDGEEEAPPVPNFEAKAGEVAAIQEYLAKKSGTVAKKKKVRLVRSDKGKDKVTGMREFMLNINKEAPGKKVAKAIKNIGKVKVTPVKSLGKAKISLSQKK